MKLGLHAIKNPAGSWSLVGNVPARLAYTGENVTPEHIEEQLRLPASYRTIKARTWLTESDLKAELREILRRDFVGMFPEANRDTQREQFLRLTVFDVNELCLLVSQCEVKSRGEVKSNG